MIGNKTVDDLARIALAGGGLCLDAKGYTPDNLVRIALAAKSKGSCLDIENSDSLTVDAMARIALAGGGCVMFK